MAVKSKKRLPDMVGWTNDKIAEFWETHDSADYWNELKTAKRVEFGKPQMSVISLQLAKSDLGRIKAIAARKRLKCTTLLRLWIREKLIEATQLDRLKRILRRLMARLPSNPQIAEIRAALEPESEIVSFWIKLEGKGEPVCWRAHPSQLEGTLALPQLERELRVELEQALKGHRKQQK